MSKESSFCHHHVRYLLLYREFSPSHMRLISQPRKTMFNQSHFETKFQRFCLSHFEFQSKISSQFATLFKTLILPFILSTFASFNSYGTRRSERDLFCQRWSLFASTRGWKRYLITLSRRNGKLQLSQRFNFIAQWNSNSLNISSQEICMFFSYT